MQQTLTVSIGRAIPDTDGGELDPGLWDEFKSETFRAVQFFAVQVLFTGEGKGYWTEDGTTVTEDSFTVVALIDPTERIYSAGLDDDTRGNALADRLRAVRARFLQTAAAVTYGRTDLI